MNVGNLNPSWIRNATEDGFDLSQSCAGAQGLLHDEPYGKGARIYWFSNPIVGAYPAPACLDPWNRWHREGHTFEAITLTRVVRAGGPNDV